MQTTDAPVVIEQTYKSSVKDVWNAITEPSRMREWFFAEMDDFDPATGFETKFSVQADDKVYQHCWKLTEVVPQQRIVYDWSYEGLAGRGLVTWELESITDGTKLTLTNTIAESFPIDDPVFRRESCVAGWQYFINEQLMDYLQPES